MKYAIAVLLLFISSFHVEAQNYHLDSLVASFAKTNNTVDKIALLNQLSVVYSETGMLSQSHTCAAEALTLSQNNAYPKGIGLSCYSFALLNQYKGDLNLALNFHEKALTIFEEIKDYKNLGFVYLNIGIVLSAQKKYKEAITFEKKALELFNQIHFKQGIAYANINLGISFFALNQIPQALLYNKKAEDICKEIHDYKGLGYVYFSLGKICNQSDCPKALVYFAKYKEIKNNTHDAAGISFIDAHIGLVYLKMHEYSKARSSFTASLRLSDSIADLKGFVRAYEGLYRTDSAEKKYSEAFSHLQKYYLFKDSVLKLESGHKVLMMQGKFETAKKNLDIEHLKTEQEKQHLINEEDSERIIFLIITIALIIITVSVFSYILNERYKIVNRQKVIISKQKEQIVEQFKNIRDSIVNANRIQKALLTRQQYIQDSLNKELFIYYQPKDIVSGDFYWAVMHERKFYIITADCTGHGVPGAFMSLLNISFLNEMILKKNILNPAEILLEQRKAIVNALHSQEVDNSQDGMDCVLCCFDLDSFHLTFAGANNPLWVIRDRKLMVFKGDRMPVGMYSDLDKPFINQEIQLQKGDIVYTFTDGIPDQFGGAQDKKYKTSRLSELLLHICNLSMAQQKEIIAAAIKGWAGSTPQTDDILIVGIKI